MLVVAILVALAGMVTMVVGDIRGSAEVTVTNANLRTLRDAFMGNASQVGLVNDVPGFDRMAFTIHDLFSRFHMDATEKYPPFDPSARKGWRGPYVASAPRVRNTVAAREGLFPASGDIRFGGDTTFLVRGFYNDASTSPYGVAAQHAFADAWGNPIVLQYPTVAVDDAEAWHYARLVSAGPDGILQTPAGTLDGYDLGGSRGDDLVIFLNRTDVDE